MPAGARRRASTRGAAPPTRSRPVARRPRAGAAGRPPCEEWASLLSTWTRPASASERMPAAVRSRRKKSAVAWTSAPAAISAAIRSYMSAERWRSGWAISARWPRSARCATRREQGVAERPGAGSSRIQRAAAERHAAQLLLAQRLDRGLGHLAPLQDRRPARPPRAGAALTRLDPSASSSMRTSWSWRMCGVAQTRSIPSFDGLAADARRCRAGRAPRRRAPGRMWQCRSIKRSQVAPTPGANALSGRRTGMGLR